MDNPTSLWQHQLRELVTGTTGLVCLWLIIGLFLWSTVSRSGRWALLCALLYASSFQTDAVYAALGRHLIPPLDQIRVITQPLIFALVMIVGVRFVASPPLRWRRHMPSGIALFLLFLFVYDMRQVISGDVGRGALGLLTHTAIFAGLMFGLSRRLRDLRDCHVLLRCVAVIGLLFAVGSAIQLLVNSDAILWQGRFEGTSGNAQKAAIFIAPVLLTSCYLVAQRSEPVIWRIVMGCTSGILSVFLLWTGSRTGILMVVIALPLLFRLRLGRGAVAIAICGLALLVATHILGIELSGSVDRLTRTLDDRTQFWRESWNVFLTYPVFGAGMVRTAFHESSYFSAAAVTGIAGLAPLMAAIALIGFSLLRLHRLRRELGPHVMIADLVTATLVSLAVGSAFEAILLGTLANGILMVFIFLTLLRFLLDPVPRAAAVAPATEDLHPSMGAPPDSSAETMAFYNQYSEAYH